MDEGRYKEHASGGTEVHAGHCERNRAGALVGGDPLRENGMDGREDDSLSNANKETGSRERECFGGVERKEEERGGRPEDEREEEEAAAANQLGGPAPRDLRDGIAIEEGREDKAFT